MTGMRKWMTAHRQVVRATVIAVVLAAAVAIWVRLGHPLGQTLVTAAVYAALMVSVHHLTTRNTDARLDAQGAILVYVRYPDVLPGSLSGIWELGVATFEEPARMRFQPAASETLQAVGRATTFSALAAASPEPRKINRKERKCVPYQVVDAIRLTTDKGDMEVAAHRRRFGRSWT
jgi:hypothetical protein